MTAAGKIDIVRTNFECQRCRDTSAKVDVSLGFSTRYSKRARRLITLAGGSWGFETAEKHLEEMSGIDLSANTIKKVTCETGQEMKQWQRESKELHEEFAQTPGNTELMTDGTCVKTTKGWREVKVTIFAKRDEGEPRTRENLDALPKPTIQFAFAQITGCQRLASSLPHWKKRLKIHAPWDVAITTDGAKWIENVLDVHFPNADRLLDIFHACEHFRTMFKGLFREKATRKEHFERFSNAALSRGWEGLCDEFTALKNVVSPHRWQRHCAKTFSYFHSRRKYLNYPGRLASGRPIGSGMVEGACKQIVGRRLKPSAGTCWRVQTVNRMLGVLTLLHSSAWEQYWCGATTR